MSRPPAEVEWRLIEAIHNQSLRQATEEILGESNASSAQGLAKRARAACISISAEMQEIRAEALDCLRADGISAEPVLGPEEDGALQYHITGLRVAPSELGTAVSALETLGFRSSLRLTPARLRVILRTARTLRLVRFEGVSARIDLHFANKPLSRLPRVLHPRMADMGVVDLPKALAPAYWLIRPFRIVLSRLTGKAQPISENDLLGTPDSLIAPILSEIGLSPDDVLVDLGCGDGRIVEAAAELGAKAIGYEIDTALANEARSRVARFGDRARIVAGPAETADLSSATVVFLFVPSHLAARLMPMLRRALRPGARIVAHEQIRLHWAEAPDQRRPIFSENALTVVHIWQNDR